jgi:glycosyltransferase involved in cell wall biosynthesis
MRAAVLVVAYESSDYIVNLLDRIPSEVPGADLVVYVSDDCSHDDTCEKAEKWAAEHGEREVVVVRQERNHGYGGNQKLSYEWAEQSGDVDVAVLLHGDEQYPPEVIPELVAPILEGEADVVHGSRMIIPGGARRGGMPIDRYLGNRSLSWLLNRLSGAELTEWFSGFRAYRISTLAQLDLAAMPDGFDFDTTITLRILEAGGHIQEVAIPTRYGDEISRVPLLRTGLAAVRHGVAARLRRPGRRRVARRTMGSTTS